MYKKVPTDMNFVGREKEVEEFWEITIFVVVDSPSISVESLMFPLNWVDCRTHGCGVGKVCGFSPKRRCPKLKVLISTFFD